MRAAQFSLSAVNNTASSGGAGKEGGGRAAGGRMTGLARSSHGAVFGSSSNLAGMAALGRYPSSGLLDMPVGRTTTNSPFESHTHGRSTALCVDARSHLVLDAAAWVPNPPMDARSHLMLDTAARASTPPLDARSYPVLDAAAAAAEEAAEAPPAEGPAVVECAAVPSAVSQLQTVLGGSGTRCVLILACGGPVVCMTVKPDPVSSCNKCNKVKRLAVGHVGSRDRE